MITKEFCTETKVVGVTKNNDKGIPIQKLLPSLKEGDRLILIRDYGNEYDENAIKIYNRDGNHIGYLSASLAENISPFLEENPKYDIEGVVRCITGGADGKLYGCNITVWIQDPDEPSFEELHAFARNMYDTESKKHKNIHDEQFHKNQAVIEQKLKRDDSILALFLISVIVSCVVMMGVALLIMSLLEDGVQADKKDSKENLNSAIVSNIDDYWSESPQSSIKTESSTTSTTKKENTHNNSSKTTSGSIFSASENEVLVKVKDIDLKTTILPPNSIGTIWMEATYTNNSNYAISSVSYKYLCKDTNETHYLASYDTVLPGETSPLFDGFGPKSGKYEDIQFLIFEITIIDKSDTRVRIEYDYKLDSYKMY